MKHVQIRDIILDIAQLKRHEDELVRELNSVKNEILKKEHFLYDSFQNEAIELARNARREAEATHTPTPKKPD